MELDSWEHCCGVVSYSNFVNYAQQSLKADISILSLFFYYKLMEVLSIVCSCVDGRRGSGMYSLWRLLATVHLKYDNIIIVKTLLVHVIALCLRMPYSSVLALERS